MSLIYSVVVRCSFWCPMRQSGGSPPLHRLTTDACSTRDACTCQVQTQVPCAGSGSLTKNTSRGDYLKPFFISAGKECGSGFSPVGMVKPPSSCLPLTCWLLVGYSDYGTLRFTSQLFFE